MLSETKRDRILQGQTTTARKVYDAIPIAEPWDTYKIAAELERRGVSIDFSIMVGCINTLIRAGLAAEPERRTYIRTPVRAKAVQAIVSSVLDDDDDDTTDIEDINTMPAPVQNPARQKPGKGTPQTATIDRLGALAEKATSLANELKKLSAEIETAAIDIAEQIADVEAKAEKLRKFQALLSEISQ